VDNVYKTYSGNRVLEGITFYAKRGEALGLLGRNGSGKSTTMNIISGYIASDSGKVEIDGFNILENPIEVKKNFGYLPEQPPLYPELKVKEYLAFICEMKKINRKEILYQVEHSMEIAGITSVADMLTRSLSKGYRQRVGFAAAMCGEPPLLILDEPTSGLDPVQIVEFRNKIKELKGKHTILIASHILNDLEYICDRIIIIHKGAVVASGTKKELYETMKGTREVVVRTRGNRDDLEKKLSKLAGIDSLIARNEEEDTCIFRISCKQDIRSRIAEVIIFSGAQLLELHSPDSSLEDIFLKVANS
jgi:ABC-2 type transport system ATP-binding protein